MILSKEIIVIGGNAAGAAAAAKAKRVNPEANVLVFEAGEYISSGTCEIPYVLSGDINDYQEIIFYNPESFKKEKGVNIYIRHHVKEINRKDKEIRVVDLFNGTTHFYKYDKLILATGSVIKPVKEFSIPAENLFELKNIGNLIKIQNYLENNVRNISIIGAGYTGAETADALSRRGFNVSIIEKELHPIPSAEPEIQLLLHEFFTENKIRFFGGVKNLKPNYSDNRIISLNIEGRIIDTDLVIISTGFQPDSGLAVKAGLKTGVYGGITVDATLKTSDPHIYAAGDCIEVINEITHRPFYLPLSTIAHDYGHTAGENAAGRNQRVKPVVRNLSVKLGDKFYINTGMTSNETEAAGIKFNSVSETGRNISPVMPGSTKVFGKVIYEVGSGRILGASFFGSREVSGYGDLISALIRTRQPAYVLAEINYNYTPPLSPQIHLLSILGRKIIRLNKGI